MIGQLIETHAAGLGAFLHAWKHVLHQLAGHAIILRRRIDRDGAETADLRSLVEEIAAHNLAVDFRDNAVELRMLDQHVEQFGGKFGRRKIGRKLMVVGQCFKGAA